MSLLREQFPILNEKTFLNSCSKGALSLAVRQAYREYLDDWEKLGSPWDLWVGKLEQSRQLFAALINAEPDEIAVVTSVSQAVSSLASAFDFTGQRNRVVVSDFEFPTVAQIWHVQEQRGAKVVHAAAVGNEIPLSQYAQCIDNHTALVAAAHVCYRNGVKQDVAAIARLAHSQGALVLVDAYQSLGTTPIDVKALDADILVGGALKYLLGSSGLAWMYVRRDLIPRIQPTTGGWFTQANIFAMDIYHHRPSASARRFEAGTPANPSLYAGIAGLQIIQTLGLDQIEAQIGVVTDAIKQAAISHGFELATSMDRQRHGAMIAIRAQQVEALVKRLEQDGIITSSRDGNLRISPHFYNDVGDVERLMAALVRQRALID